MNRNRHNTLDDRPPELGGTWPPFLDLMTSEPDRCFREFYDYATKLLRVCPPAPVRILDEEGRQDLLHDLVLHCCRNNFKILRSYADRGRPFAAWLQLVARNKALDTYRSARKREAVSLDDTGDEDRERQIPDSRPSHDDAFDHREALNAVMNALQMLSSKCQILVKGAAEGCKPRELVCLMGWPPDWNKKASDDLRECRKRLRDILSGMGLDGLEAL